MVSLLYLYRGFNTNPGTYLSVHGDYICTWVDYICTWVDYICTWVDYICTWVDYICTWVYNTCCSYCQVTGSIASSYIYVCPLLCQIQEVRRYCNSQGLALIDILVYTPTGQGSSTIQFSPPTEASTVNSIILKPAIQF